MKANRKPLLSSISSRLRRGWAAPALALLAAAVPARADHVYNAWTQQFDLTKPNPDEARAVVTDSRGNVVMAGEVFNSSNVRQWYVAKYDGLDGHLIVGKIILGPANAGLQQTAPIGDSFVRSIAVDSQDNIIVAGGSKFDVNHDEDFETIKLSPTLTQIWARLLNNAAQNGADEVQKVAVDANDNVIVTGNSPGSGTGDDFLTVKYASAGGLTFQKRLNITGNSNDTPTGLAIEAATGNIWVVGTSKNNPNGEQTVTMAYDSTGAALNNNFPVKHGVTNGDSNGAAIVLDSGGSAFITGTDFDSGNNHSIYTAKVLTGGFPLFEKNYVLSQNGDSFAFARDIAIGLDDNPVVTGVEDSGSGTLIAVTLKYEGQAGGVGLGTLLWHRDDPGLSPPSTANPAFPQYDSAGEKVVVDGAGTVTIAGETAANSDGTTTYVARYSADTGAILDRTTFDNGYKSHADTAEGIAVDGSGNISITATVLRPIDASNQTGNGDNGILTQKFQRFIAATADDLPPDGANARLVSILNAPALADSGDVVGRITLSEGKAKTKLSAIFTQAPAGGTELPLVQKMSAPGVQGFGNATFASFGDPVISPDGHYAFPAKLAGGVPAAKASSIWTNLGGNLHLALEQGTPVPGLTTVNVSSVASVSLRNTELVALVKVSGTTTENMVLLGLNAANTGTVLLRTGPANPLTVNGAASYIQTLTALSASPNQAGDGRWQGDGLVVAKGVLHDKRTVLFKVTNAGTVTPFLYTGGDATIVNANATWKTFGLPAVGSNNFSFSVLATANTETGVSSTSDTAIINSFAGTPASFALVAREGAAASASTGLTGISYSAFSNPITNAGGDIAFLATLKATAGSGVKVAATNNRALLFGAPGAVETVARTGQKAPDSAGNIPAANPPVFASFSTFALAAGTPGTPIFVAKVSGKGTSAKNNLGVWGVDTSGTVRQILRTGEKLGPQTVTNITLLKATPQAFAAARSFNDNGGVVMLVAFSDHTSALLELQLP
jgi:hypothetical protein